MERKRGALAFNVRNRGAVREEMVKSFLIRAVMKPGACACGQGAQGIPQLLEPPDAIQMFGDVAGEERRLYPLSRFLQGY